MQNTLVLAGIGGFSVPEMLIALLIVLLLFGARKLPELAHSMGSSIQAFKKGMKASDEPPAPPSETKHDDPARH